MAAAERASLLSSHREAAAHYGRALSVADGLPDEQRADLFEARARECYMSHQLDASLEAAEAALELWQRLGDRRRQAQSLLDRKYSYLNVARWLPRVEPMLQKVTELLEGLPAGPELALVCSDVGDARAARVPQCRGDALAGTGGRTGGGFE